MRVVSYNILNGGVGRADPIAEILEANRPDVVCLLEADDCNVVERIARRLGMDFIVGGAEKHPGAILSRFAIRESINYAPLTQGITKSFLQVGVQLPSGVVVTIVAVHLHAHAVFSDESKRMEELQLILSRTAPLRREGVPHLLCGDFNANAPLQQIERAEVKPATREEMDQNGGVIPREVIARVLTENYVDTLAAVAGGKAATMGSFSTQYPGQRVDYIFAHGIAVGQITDAWIETDRLARFASDHYPVGVELAL